MSASPALPFKFNVNVQSVLEVVDLQAQQQDTSALLALRGYPRIGGAPCQ